MNSTVTAAIATFNEELNIVRCLQSLDFVDEIIIVDGNSTDNTVSLAKKFPKVKIFSTDNKAMFHINKQMAFDHAKSDWILYLDADEVISPRLKQELISLLKKSSQSVTESAFWLNRRNYFLGHYLRKGGQYPDPTIRFFKRGHARLPCKSVHEQVEVRGSVGHLNSDLIHYAYSSFSRYLSRYNRYTSLMAAELRQAKIPLNLVSFLNYSILKPSKWFFLSYFRHKGFVDAFPGFVFAYFSALRFFIAYIKYWEFSVSKGRADLYQDWNAQD